MGKKGREEKEVRMTNYVRRGGEREMGRRR